MPGIVGIISDRSATECQALVRTMLASMDYERFYISGTYSAPEMRVYAGWVSHEGSFTASQPFCNESRDITLLFSGECFIDRQERSELSGSRHGASKRGARIIDLYEKHGDRFFEKLNGLFSGLLIDERQRKAFLFNDRYGIERIYWHEANGDFYFASEAKALLRVVPQLRQFDSEAVAEFLAYGCTTGTRSLFRGINILPGGSAWSFEQGKCHKQKYFSAQTWESQSILSQEAFDGAFEQTFKRILPSYFNSELEYGVGISLTGGLDTRLIMACRPKSDHARLCYTFSGREELTLDDRLAAKVATACGLDHQLLRIGPEFFSNFDTITDRTVYITDGALGPTGSHEIHFNRQARQLAPVRLTGNYGSEIFRGISTFKPLRLTPDLFESRFGSDVNSLARLQPFANEHRVTFSAFREIPLKLIGTLLAARSQMVFRTPYLDNEMIALAYRNPEPLSRSPRIALRVIQTNNPVLGRIASDMGFRADDSLLLARVRYLLHRATFKLDYYYNETPPHWLLPLESVFTRLGFGLGILGLHKYLHYRSWFRRELASYLHDAMRQAENRQSRFWNCDFLQRMVEDHISGRRNYVGEINAVLNLDAVERLLFRSSPGEASTIPPSLSSKATRRNHDELIQSVSLKFSAKDSAPPGWLPTFLGIGSMRCGSTWLYEVLKLHPDIRMSDAKEMDFFFMPQMLQYDLSWYEAHFRPNNGSKPKPVRGEISPRYVRLKAWQVNRIAELLPDLRIILTLRHPIERVWSQTLYDFGRLQGRDLYNVNSIDFLRQLERPRSTLSSDYCRTIRIWSNAFGRRALHVALFDELRDDPTSYVNGILRHIGAASPWVLPERFLNNKVFATKGLVMHEKDIPELVRWYIADQLLEPTERLNELLEGRVSSWVDEIRAIRGKTRLGWRILRELNRTIISFPEGLAYETYHAFLDVRLWRRWRHLQMGHLSDKD